MKINGIDRLRDFEGVHPAARGPLSRWCAVVRGARWGSFAEVRDTFGTASMVRLSNRKTVVVFNVGGNKFRLAAFVQYQTGLVVVGKVLSHADYDTDKWKDEL
jgi:mRNA interferase HigB